MESWPRAQACWTRLLRWHDVMEACRIVICGFGSILVSSRSRAPDGPVGDNLLSPPWLHWSPIRTSGLQ